MKRFFGLALLSITLFAGTSLEAQQDKSKRPSPPAIVTRTIQSGATVTISYSQPALKGRTIGKDVEPMVGKAWRMGANEATVFETDKEVSIEGQPLPPGKYSLFGIAGEKDFTLVFNKAWKIWGTQYEQNKEQDALSVTVKKYKVVKSKELLTYMIDKNGKVNLTWGTMAIDFKVK